MGNWEKVFNRKLALHCNVTVVKGELTQSVSLKCRGLLLTIFLLKVLAAR